MFADFAALHILSVVLSGIDTAFSTCLTYRSPNSLFLYGGYNHTQSG